MGRSKSMGKSTSGSGAIKGFSSSSAGEVGRDDDVDGISAVVEGALVVAGLVDRNEVDKAEVVVAGASEVAIGVLAAMVVDDIAAVVAVAGGAPLVAGPSEVAIGVSLSTSAVVVTDAMAIGGRDVVVEAVGACVVAASVLSIGEVVAEDDT